MGKKSKKGKTRAGKTARPPAGHGSSAKKRSNSVDGVSVSSREDSLPPTKPGGTATANKMAGKPNGGTALPKNVTVETAAMAASDPNSSAAGTKLGLSVPPSPIIESPDKNNSNDSEIKSAAKTEEPAFRVVVPPPAAACAPVAESTPKSKRDEAPDLQPIKSGEELDLGGDKAAAPEIAAEAATLAKKDAVPAAAAAAAAAAPVAERATEAVETPKAAAAEATAAAAAAAAEQPGGDVWSSKLRDAVSPAEGSPPPAAKKEPAVLDVTPVRAPAAVPGGNNKPEVESSAATAAAAAPRNLTLDLNEPSAKEAKQKQKDCSCTIL